MGLEAFYSSSWQLAIHCHFNANTCDSITSFSAVTRQPFKIEMRGKMSHLLFWNVVHFTRATYFAPREGFEFACASTQPRREFPPTVRNNFYAKMSPKEINRNAWKLGNPYKTLLRSKLKFILTFKLFFTNGAVIFYIFIFMFVLRKYWISAQVLMLLLLVLEGEGKSSQSTSERKTQKLSW